MSNNIEDKSSLNSPAELSRSQDESNQVVDQDSNHLQITNSDSSACSMHEDNKSVINIDQISGQPSQSEKDKELGSQGLIYTEESESLNFSNYHSYVATVSNEKQAFFVELPDLSDEYYFNSIKDKNGNKIEAKRLTFARKSWARVTWLLTWWIPSSLFTRYTKTARSDVQMKWREKIAICILTFLFWFVLLLIAIGSGLLSNFSSNNYTINYLHSYQGTTRTVYMYGSVYDLDKLAKLRHAKSPAVPDGVTADDMEILEGKDITSLFPLDPKTYCQGLDNIPDRYEFYWHSDYSYMEYNPVVASQDFERMVHRTNKFRGQTVSDDPLWYYNEALPALKNIKIGTVVYPRKVINQYRDWQWNIGIINGKVYDISIYVNNTRSALDKKWIPTEVVNIFKPNATSRVKNGDITELWDSLELKSPEYKQNVMSCLENLFYVGEVDRSEPRNSVIYNYSPTFTIKSLN